MTTFKEAQNEVGPVQVESVEGEYLTPQEYCQLRIDRVRDEMLQQKLELAAVKARMKARDELNSTLLFAAVMGRFR